MDTDVVRQIKERLDIVELVGDYVTLRKVGRQFQGLCPFHKEKTPSFYVSAERQSYHCFGCGAGGDVFSFFMAQEGVDFAEARRMLAQRAGVAKGTVYNYFADKKEVVFFVLKRNGEALTREMEEIRMLGLDPAAELQRVLESLVLGIHRHRNVIAAVIRVVEENPELHSLHGPGSKNHPMRQARGRC